MHRTYGLAPDKVELGLLLAFFVFLPLYEAPKNILLCFYLLYWFIRRLPESAWGRGDKVFEGIIWIIFGLSLITTIYNNALNLKHWSDHLDWLRLGLIGVATSRTSWCERTLSLVFLSVVVGIVLAVVEGILRGGAFPSLNSVGHINQAAMYLAITFAIFIGDLSRKRTIIPFILQLGIIFGLLALIVATGSRNAFYASLGLITVFIFYSVFVRSLVSGRVAFLIFFVVFILIFLEPSLIHKQLAHLASGSFDAGREGVWRAAFSAIDLDNLLLGTGVDSYGQAVTEEVIRANLESPVFNSLSQNLVFSDHGHNLFVTWIVERGLIAVGFVAYLNVYLLLKGVRNLRALTSVLQNKEQKGFALLSIWIAVVLLSIGNTTLHHEHGLLLMAVTGILMSFIHDDKVVNMPT
jgi:O-antigen ligase